MRVRDIIGWDDTEAKEMIAFRVIVNNVISKQRFVIMNIVMSFLVVPPVNSCSGALKMTVFYYLIEPNH